MYGLCHEKKQISYQLKLIEITSFAGRCATTGNTIPGRLAILSLQYWQYSAWNDGNTIPGILVILNLEYW